MKTRIVLACICAIALLFQFSCHKEEPPVPEVPLTPYTPEYPSYFPEMPLPGDNPMTVEGVELGRYLYYDTLLSNDGRSCSSCHNQEFSFSNPQANSLPHVNLAWNSTFLWNGSVNGMLEDAMLFEVEDFFQTDIAALNNNAFYKEKFNRVFGVETISSKEVAYALAQYTRSMISGNSKFDRYMRYEEMLSIQELNGYSIFYSERGDCFHCHSVGLFSDNHFHNIGLDSVYNASNSGLYTFTGNAADKGKFKTPTLRNIALTGPYMHDGRFTTLAEVVDHYNSQVKITPTVDPIMTKPNHINGLNLSVQDRADLVAFLQCLTDTSFTSDPRFSDPH